MTTVDGIRARNRAAIEAEVLAIARVHLAEHGAAALSLRAIARDLGMVSSALYRYVASRDDLLTLLIVRSYTELADAAQAAHDAVPSDRLRDRYAAIAHAVRGWALAHPHDWSLLYGSPVPDYDAPGERTIEPGTRVTQMLVRLLADATRAGALGPSARTTDPDVVRTAEQGVGFMLADPGFAGVDLSPVTVLRGVQSWNLLVGTVSAEVFEQLGPVPAWDPIFAATVDTMCDLVLA